MLTAAQALILVIHWLYKFSREYWKPPGEAFPCFQAGASMRPEEGGVRRTPRWFRDAQRFSTRHRNFPSANSWAAKRLLGKRPDSFFSQPPQISGVPSGIERARRRRRIQPAILSVCVGEQAARRTPGSVSGLPEAVGGVLLGSPSAAFPVSYTHLTLPTNREV